MTIEKYSYPHVVHKLREMFLSALSQI